MDLAHNALKFTKPLSGLNFLRQTPCIPTPTDSDAVAWEKKGEGGMRKRRTLFYRIQLSGDYKLLSISSRACYSCKGQHYWEGCTKLQEGKSKLLAVRGNDGRWVCAVPRSLLLIDGGKQESMLLTADNNSFSIKHAGGCTVYFTHTHYSLSYFVV